MQVPTFLGIGAQRAGTTTLHRLLETHPEVYVPAHRKEVHYFDSYYERGMAWYRSFFDGAAGNPRIEAIGETSPRYLVDPRVPERIHRHLPGVRLIAVLHHPVDRTYSQYFILKEVAFL